MSNLPIVFCLKKPKQKTTKSNLIQATPSPWKYVSPIYEKWTNKCFCTYLTKEKNYQNCIWIKTAYFSWYSFTFKGKIKEKM